MMTLEETEGAQRDAGNRLFGFIEGLAAEAPRLVGSGQAYGAPSDRGVFVYLTFVSRNPRKNPRASIHIMARWDDRLEGDGVVRGSNWFGDVSADLVIQPERMEEVARAARFIRDAYKFRRGG